MGNYEQLKQAVSDVIKTNGNQEITGAIMRNALLSIISTVGGNATFAGIATPTTNPGTPDQNVFYLAAQPGVYSNFGSVELTDQVLIFTNKNGSWVKKDTGIATSAKVTELEGETLLSANPNIRKSFQYMHIEGTFSANEKLDIWGYNKNDKTLSIGYTDSEGQRSLFGTIKVYNANQIMEGGAFSIYFKCNYDFIDNILDNYKELGGNKLNTAYLINNTFDVGYKEISNDSLFTTSDELSDNGLYANDGSEIANNDKNWKRAKIDVSGLIVKSIGYFGYVPVGYKPFLFLDKNGNALTQGQPADSNNNIEDIFMTDIPNNVSYICFNMSSSVNMAKIKIRDNSKFYVNTEDSVTLIDINNKLSWNKGYVDYNTGLYISDSLWKRKRFIALEGEKINIKNADISANVACIAVYDENGIYLKSKSVYNTKNKTYVIPKGVYSIEVSVLESNKNFAMGVTPEYSALIDNFYGNKKVVKNLYKNGLRNYISGNVSFIGDSNWEYTTAFLSVKEGDVLYIDSYAFKDSGLIFAYDEQMNQLDDKGFKSTHEDTYRYVIKYTVPNGVSYIRISKGSKKLNAERYSIKEEVRSDRELGYVPALLPKSIYVTYNDIIDAGDPYKNRNYFASLYLDHCINETSGLDLYFENGSNQLNITSQFITNSAWNCKVNNDKEVDIFTKEFALFGVDADKVTKGVQVISTKSSLARNRVAKVLCIGDSITWGEGATEPNVKGTDASRKPYHCGLHEFYLMDNKDSGNNDFKVITLGTISINSTFRYKDEDIAYMSCCEGYRGESMSGFLAGNNATGNGTSFDLDSWLSKYRTLDDEGERLTVGNGTGYMINKGNIDSINVCTPTHVVIALGANGGYTKKQLDQMVTSIKTSFPNVYIAIAIFDIMGVNTFKSSENPAKVGKSKDDKYADRYALQLLVENYINEKDDSKVFSLPFFYVCNPVHSSVLNVLSPNSEEIEMLYGWAPKVHIGKKAQYECAYQLYSWINYTMSL